MANGCKGCVSDQEVSEVRLITKRNRPQNWVEAASPGDLFLFGDRVGSGGGLLRLRYAKAFVTLTEEQVWRGRPVAWPFAGDVIRFRIMSTKITYFKK